MHVLDAQTVARVNVRDVSYSVHIVNVPENILNLPEYCNLCLEFYSKFRFSFLWSLILVLSVCEHK